MQTCKQSINIHEVYKKKIIHLTEEKIPTESSSSTTSCKIKKGKKDIFIEKKKKQRQ